MEKRNIRLLLQYDGTSFHGWQIQSRLVSVQGVLTNAVRKLTLEEVHLHGSGRTDAGTHALGQICNFRTSSRIPLLNLQKALNSLLPPSIRILQVEEAPWDFHARKNARWKHYRYRILNSRWCSPFDFPFVHHFPRGLDFESMSQAASLVVGTKDFTSFCDADSEAESKVRTVYSSFFMFDSHKDLIEYNVCADGFLHHMVRNLVGTFLEIGRGNRAAEDISVILESKSRSAAGPTSPAKGLFLVHVGYEEFDGLGSYAQGSY